MKTILTIYSILLLLGLIGCTPTHLVYVHESSLGVILTPVSTEGTSKFSLGFDQETYALVPEKPNSPADDGEAMSLAGVSRIYVRGISDLKFGHVIATGKAAAEVANSGDALEQVQKKLFEKQNTQ